MNGLAPGNKVSKVFKVLKVSKVGRWGAVEQTIMILINQFKYYYYYA